MPFSYAQYAGNGSATTFSVPFPYLLKAHVKLFYGYDLVSGTSTSELVDGVGFTWTTGTQVQTTVAPAVGQTLTIIRQTPTSALVVQWQDGSNLVAEDLQDSSLQVLYAVQEQEDVVSLSAAESATAAASVTTAVTTANAAVATANAANATANGIAATANTALSNSAAAVTTANAANATASGIAATANTALSNSAAAVTTANAANALAAAAVPSGVGAIVNADVNASAGIVASKLAFLQSGIGAVTKTVDSKLKDVVSVKDFGAVGDGAANDTTAINTAITAAAAAGRRLFFPAGTYLTNGIFISSANVHIEGEGRYVTTIKGSSTVSNVFAYSTGATNCVLKSLTIDQVKVNAGHGIRLGGVDGLVISDVLIENCLSYGIGVQQGSNKNVLVDLFEINNTGLDGIDIKDYDLANENIVISNGIIRNFGSDSTTATGLDIRGPVTAHGLIFKTANAAGAGFRLRAATVQGRDGSGTFSDMYVDGLDGGLTYGFYTASGTQYVLSNFLAVNTFILAGIEGSNGLIKNLSGWSFTSTAELISISGSDNIIDGLHINASGQARHIDFEPGASKNIIKNFVLNGTVTGPALRVQATCEDNIICDGFLKPSMGGGDLGTNTTIRNVLNYTTVVQLASADLLIDSVGTRTFAINHGLAHTPNIQDVTMTIARSVSSAGDHRITLAQIDTVTSTQVSGRIVVTTASATSGASVKVHITARIKNA